MRPTFTPAAAPVPVATAAGIRPLRTSAELHACVELQKETWGREFADVVPPSMLKVVQRIGGVAGGAFDDADRLLGMVFGITGVERGRIVHWSDMLAVRPEARDLGLGRRLKAWQREQAIAAGAETMYWTYDPLVARNAHLNFNRLGVQLAEYVEDMYGASESELHRGLGTDRLVVAWPLDREPELPDENEIRGRALTVPELDPDEPGWVKGDRWIRISIPHDILRVRSESPDGAMRWRTRTRRAFQWALGRGYTVRGFAPPVRDEPGCYLLERGA